MSPAWNLTVMLAAAALIRLYEEAMTDKPAPYVFTDAEPTGLKGLAAWLPEPGSTPPPEYLALGELLRSLDPITDKMIAGTITKKEAKRARKLLRKAMKDVTG